MTDRSVYLRCSICDYSSSNEESMVYSTEKERKDAVAKNRWVVLIDPRDGKPICTKCNKKIREINEDKEKLERERQQLESWVDRLLFEDDSEVELLTDDEILKGIKE